MTEEPFWRWVAASVRGTAHVESGTPCQDYFACRLIGSGVNKTLVLTVADGAGSALHSHVGSATACQAFLASVENSLASSTSKLTFTTDLAQSWLLATRAELKRLSDDNGHPIREYASTLLVAIIQPEQSMYIQIGDGLIVAQGEDQGGWSWIFWPNRSEYANETYFLSDDRVLDSAQIELTDHCPAEVALLTDGIERLVVTYADKSVYAPFFDRNIRPVRQCENEAENAGLSLLLAKYLRSTEISARTDDDITLVLASRWAPIMPHAEPSPCDQHSG